MRNSNISPHVKIHEMNKNLSLIFDTKDLKGLSQRLKKVLNKNYEVMSKASKERVFCDFFRNYQKICRELLESK